MTNRLKAKQIGSGITVTMHGWYDPTTNEPANGVCVVQECGQRSTFHLCKNHALPGMVAESEDRKFVISTWLVEREGRKCLITLNDYALGDLFGGREAFEQQLRDEGYGIRHLVSRVRDLVDIKRRDPDIPMGPWIPREGIPQVTN